MNTNKKTARIAGVLYLIYIIFHVFANVIGRSNLIVYGDAVTTAQNIVASAWQFRIGFVSDLFSAVLFLLAAWALYGLLKPGHENIALLFLLFNLGGVAVECFSDLFLFAGSLLLSGADYLKAFQSDQLQALAMFSLDLHKNGFTIAQIFFDAWLLPLGWLFYKSGFMPKTLGILLMVGCFGYLADAFAGLVMPDWQALTKQGVMLAALAELATVFWLLVLGSSIRLKKQRTKENYAMQSPDSFP